MSEQRNTTTFPETFDINVRKAAKENIAPLTAEYIRRLERIASISNKYFCHSRTSSKYGREKEIEFIDAQASINCQIGG